LKIEGENPGTSPHPLKVRELDLFSHPAIDQTMPVIEQCNSGADS
jgi:hypothetical protein